MCVPLKDQKKKQTQISQILFLPFIASRWKEAAIQRKDALDLDAGGGMIGGGDERLPILKTCICWS